MEGYQALWGFLAFATWTLVGIYSGNLWLQIGGFFGVAYFCRELEYAKP